VSLFRRFVADPPPLTVEAGPLLLRPPIMADYEAWAALRAESRSFLEPWEPVWGRDDLERSAFRRRLRRYQEEMDRDEAYPFLIFRKADGALLGGLNLTNVRRGAADMVSLGYWMGRHHADQGHMTRAVRAVAHTTFNELRLRRIEAACLPENKASMRLLEKVGFQREGLARDYLAIAGRYRDHVLFSLLKHEFRAVPPAPPSPGVDTEA
jgi:ribosomal-protein-alanine N-acetyltransferase